jgi:exopolysaccharide biosynthesis polyprenyl glycosylphosphotransferase
MKKFNLFFTAIRVPLDFLSLFFAGLTAFALRYSPYFQELRAITFDLSYLNFITILTIASLAWLPIFAMHGLYSTNLPRLAEEIKHIILAVFTGISVILLFAFFNRELFDSRFIFLASWILAVVYLSLTRIAIRIIERLLRKSGYGNYQTILIGKNDSTNALKTFFIHNLQFGFRIVKNIKKFNTDSQKEILELRRKNKVDAIIVADTDISARDLELIKAFSDNEHLHFLYMAGLSPNGAARPIMHTFAGIPIVELPKTPLDGWGSIYKRIFDIFGSLFLILITLPIQIPVALLIILESKGGIVYLQKRIGRRGEEFNFPKFRSMFKDSHKLRFDPDFIAKHGNQRSDSPLFKLENDPRITKIGRFIRKTSIDEFPQFYAVLFGKMSLVGPRPHLPEEVNLYEPYQRRVLNIKPGITGLAQISGRADLSFKDEIALDIHYIENWTPWLDLIILIRTPFAVIFSKGAY